MFMYLLTIVCMSDETRLVVGLPVETRGPLSKLEVLR
jgi:hypothetical protein